jgi:anti-sigma-K factor RskA
MGSNEKRESERELDDPLKMIEHVLGVLRTDDDRDAAIERLIRDLEDERAMMVASRLTRKPVGQ